MRLLCPNSQNVMELCVKINIIILITNIIAESTVTRSSDVKMMEYDESNITLIGGNRVFQQEL